nr:unnamed protein product [Digitaria exilis]
MLYGNTVKVFTPVVHCEKVSKEVREYFQRELERTKKLTAQRAQEKLRKEKAAAEGNYPGGGEVYAAYDEEAELQSALNQSRAEEEFRRGVQQRGGAYEHGGGSSTRGEGTLQRMLRRATSARQTPGVTDYNLGSIDTGSWTQKGKNAKEAIGKAWSKFFHTAGDDDEGDTPLPSNIVVDKINPADLRKRKYHIAPSKVVPKRQRGQATGKGKQKEIEVLSGEDTDDGEGDKSPEYQESQDSSSGDDAVMVMMAMMVVAVVAAVAVLLAVAGAEACHLQTHLLDIDHGAPMSQRRTVGPTDYDSPQFSSSSSYRESSHGLPPETDCTGDLNSKFEFNRFPPVTGQTGPVYRYRRPAVRTTGPVWLTLVVSRGSWEGIFCVLIGLLTRSAAGVGASQPAQTNGKRRGKGLPNRREPVRFDRFPTKPPRTGSAASRVKKTVQTGPIFAVTGCTAPARRTGFFTVGNRSNRGKVNPGRVQDRRFFAAGRRNRHASRLTALVVPPFRFPTNRPANRSNRSANRSNRSKPATRGIWIQNLNLAGFPPNRPANRSNRSLVCSGWWAKSEHRIKQTWDLATARQQGVTWSWSHSLATKLDRGTGQKF